LPLGELKPWLVGEKRVVTGRRQTGSAATSVAVIGASLEPDARHVAAEARWELQIVLKEVERVAGIGSQVVGSSGSVL